MAIVIGPGIEIGPGVTMTSPLYDSLAGSLQFNGSSQFLSLVPGTQTVTNNGTVTQTATKPF